MIKVVEIAFTGHPVKDMKRAREFYEGILGLRPSSVFGSEPGDFVEYEIGPGVLALGKMEGWEPSKDGPGIALEVTDFDGAVSTLREKQVKFRMEPLASPVCRMAIISDPDGNTVTIHKRNEG